MRREEIVKELGITDSGNLSRILEDLELCGFITRTNAYGSKKYNAIYRLMDNFSLFYLKFMQENKNNNVCEMKFSQSEFVIDKDYDAVLRHKLSRFAESVPRRMALHLTMVTTYGVTHNAYWNRVQSEVTANDLFAE